MAGIAVRELIEYRSMGCATYRHLNKGAHYVEHWHGGLVKKVALQNLYQIAKYTEGQVNLENAPFVWLDNNLNVWGAYPYFSETFRPDFKKLDFTNVTEVVIGVKVKVSFQDGKERVYNLDDFKEICKSSSAKSEENSWG